MSLWFMLFLCTGVLGLGTITCWRQVQLWLQILNDISCNIYVKCMHLLRARYRRERNSKQYWISRSPSFTVTSFPFTSDILSESFQIFSLSKTRGTDLHAGLDRGYESKILETGWAEFSEPNPEMAKYRASLSFWSHQTLSSLRRIQGKVRKSVNS